MELHCEAITITNGDEKKNELNPSATEFRPKQTAAEIAEWGLKDIAIEEDDGGIWKCLWNIICKQAWAI